MHVSFEIENQAITRIRDRRSTSSPGSIRRFNNLPLAAGAGAPAASNTPREVLDPLFNDQPDFPQKRIKMPEPQIPLDSASYKLYYVN
jgi:hypothetical protein